MAQLVSRALAILLLSAPMAGAAEFVPGWLTEGVWSSNVLRSVDEGQDGRKIPKEDDFSIRTGPEVRLREEQGDLTYDLSYRLRYEEFIRLNGISEFDHFARARGEWSATQRTSFFASNDISYSSSLAGLFDVFGTDISPVVRPQRERLLVNTANAGVRRRLGPLWELTLSGDHQYFDFGGEAGQEATTLTGSAQLTRGISRRLVVGLGAAAQRNESSNDITSDDAGSTFLQGFAIANYQISRTWRFSVRGGPALSMPDEIETDTLRQRSFVPVDVDSCPTRADGERFVPAAQAAGFLVAGDRCTPLVLQDQSGTFFFPFLSSEFTDVPFVGESGFEDSLTYFARIQTEKEWQYWRGSLSYSRSATNASGLGTSTIVDAFGAQLLWRPSRHWSVTLNANLTMQSAISEARSQEVAVRPGPGFVTATTRDGQEVETFFLPCTAQDPSCVAVPFEVSSGGKIDNPIDIQTYRVELRGERRFTANLSTTASASWYQQENSGVLSENKRTEYRVVFGVTWRFDPIPL